MSFSLFSGSAAPANLLFTAQTDANGNIIWGGLQPGTYVLVENAAPAGYLLPADPTATFTLAAGESLVVAFPNTAITVPTPVPPVVLIPEPVPLGPESTPTPEPTATPTPIPTDDEYIIEDVAPAYGPETGEGDVLFLSMGIMFLIGAGLLVAKKKLKLNR